MPKRNAAPRSSGIFDLLGVAQESPASSGAAAKGQSAKPAAASPEPAAAESGISAIALSALRLDLAQPRRPLPLTYATKVNSGALTLVDAIKKWAADVGLPLTLAFDAETPLAKGAAHALDLLRRELALPIFDVGLINPISVIESGEAQYTVETGERRALAHAYLVACGHAEFERVPAQIVERGEIARRQLKRSAPGSQRGAKGAAVVGGALPALRARAHRLVKIWRNRQREHRAGRRNKRRVGHMDKSRTAAEAHKTDAHLHVARAGSAS